MAPYTTVYFDLDNTLLDFNKSEHSAIFRLLSMHNLPVSDDVAKAYSGINKSFWEAFERGDIQKSDIFAGRFQKLLEYLGEERDAEAMSDDYFYCLTEEHDVIDGAFNILEYLQSKNYKVYATTNGVAVTQYKRVADAGMSSLFDGIFVSEEIGYQKPSKEYFESILNSTSENCRSRVLIVGDSQSSDILGGINAGIDTCWYNPDGAFSKYPSKYEISDLLQLKKILL